MKKFFKLLKAFWSNNNARKGLEFVFGALLSFLLTSLFNFLFQDWIVFLIALGVVVVVFVSITVWEVRVENKLNIIKIMKKDIKEEDWIEVIRLGFPLSRPLFLSNQHKLRLEIGKLVKTAAENCKEEIITIDDENIETNKVRAATCIDAIGWSTFLLNNADKEAAELYISSGQIYAERIKKPEDRIMFLIKARRHRLAIALSDNDENAFARAQKVLKEIDELLLRDEFATLNESTQTDILLGLYHAKANYEIALIDKDPNYADEHREAATQYNSKSLSLATQIGDYERECKSFEVSAKILLTYKTIEKALDAEREILEGLSHCKNYCRRDRFKSLTILLIKTYEFIICNSALSNSGVTDYIEKAKVACNDADSELKEKNKEVHDALKSIKAKYKKEKKEK